ncbi:hypothetical protein KPB2_5551 [Klebsiella pneumoniae Kb677]|nr:hypothetical protein KPB2_5551 [Klebsiella pneumoniae Kb677]
MTKSPAHPPVPAPRPPGSLFSRRRHDVANGETSGTTTSFLCRGRAIYVTDSRRQCGQRY